MRVLVENFYSDKTKIFEGSVEQVVEEILINYPYLRSPYPEDNTIESLVEELDHNQGTSAEILDQDELNKTERQSQQPVGPDSSIVRDMVGYNYKLHEAFEIEKMKGELPELPAEKRIRYKNDFGIKDEDIEMYINDPNLGQFFEIVCKNLEFQKEKVKIASNYLLSDLQGLKNKDKFKSNNTYNFSELVNMIFENKISSRVAKDLLVIMVDTGGSPLKIATEKDLLQKNDEGAIKAIVEKIISENPEVVATYKAGKENAIMSLVGKIIKESKGSANPQIVIKLLKELMG